MYELLTLLVGALSRPRRPWSLCECKLMSNTSGIPVGFRGRILEGFLGALICARSTPRRQPEFRFWGSIFNPLGLLGQPPRSLQEPGLEIEFAPYLSYNLHTSNEV